MLRLLLQELRFRRNGIIGWGLALCFFPITYVSLYPQFADQLAGFQDMMDLPFYQALGISMASFEGYVASTVTNLVPLILAIYAVINGTGTLAGEEDDGRLELIVALPVHRWQIVTVKAVALLIALILILAIVSLGSALTLAAILSQVETNVTPVGMFMGLMAALPITLAIGMISLFLGAFCSSRRIAATLATTVVLISYLGSNLAGMVSSLGNLSRVFLFHYYEATAAALENGQQAGNVAILLAVALIAFGLAVFFFQRRDITVGAWPWQRGKMPAGTTAGAE